MNSPSLNHLMDRIRPMGLQFNLTAAALTALLGVLFMASLFSAGEEQRLVRLIEAKRSSLDAFIRTRPNPPSRERFEFLKKEAESLQATAAGLTEKDFYWKPKVFRDRDRLEFKELLFDLRQNLAKMASARQVLLSPDAELPDFEASLPAVSELPGLTMAYLLSKELRTKFIEAGTTHIEALSFPTLEKHDLGGGLVRYSFPFTVKLEMTWEAWSTWLQSMTNSTYLWRYDSVHFFNQPPGPDGNPNPAIKAPFRVEMTLSGQFYSQEEKIK